MATAAAKYLSLCGQISSCFLCAKQTGDVLGDLLRHTSCIVQADTSLAQKQSILSDEFAKGMRSQKKMNSEVKKKEEEEQRSFGEAVWSVLHP